MVISVLATLTSRPQTTPSVKISVVSSPELTMVLLLHFQVGRRQQPPGEVIRALQRLRVAHVCLVSRLD
jgi:hypothetical protein